MDAKNSPRKGREYSDISPTAKYVLLFKGNTNIPYAREIAEIISLPEKYEPDYTKRDFAWWGRVLHLEERYNSINQLLFAQPVKNVLELSSGYSFRGLEAVKNQEIHYIDTDLPGLIGIKKELIKSLRKQGEDPKGKLEVLSLNAIDSQQFADIVGRFPEGPITIVNEGLLMYLNTDEKKQLCANIRNVLRARGGYWITGDVYIKSPELFTRTQRGDEMQQIMESMNVEENKFESFEEAANFFKDQGFSVEAEAVPGYANSPFLKYLLESATEEQINGLGKAGKIQATWRLKLADR